MANQGRVIWLDAARGLAVIGMVIYHFTFDLGMFGYIGPATAVSGFWALFARVVAGSFMALAGFSLFLAHPVSVNWPKYTRRLAVLVGCAALITVATYFVMPREFIFFGILHSIALASVLGLVFLRLTWWGTFIAGATIFALPQLYRSPVFDSPWLYWTGLGPTFPPTMDYEPVLPWFGVFLVGMAAAQLMLSYGPLKRRDVPPALTRALWPGRHSLVIYLAHQPILIALFSAMAWLNR